MIKAFHLIAQPQRTHTTKYVSSVGFSVWLPTKRSIKVATSLDILGSLVDIDEMAAV